MQSSVDTSNISQGPEIPMGIRWLDEEDIEQAVRFYVLKGYSVEDAVVRVNKWLKREAKRQEQMDPCCDLAKMVSHDDEAPTILASIFFPENETLKAMPVYHRYVAKLISDGGLAEAARQLGMSRMTLYRWLRFHGYRKY